MSIYEQRLEKDMQRIRDEVRQLGDNVTTALNNAALAMLNKDEALANRTIIGDKPINRAVRRVDHLCHAFIARHLPSAGHLRHISSIMRLLMEVERIGDYAVTISREAIHLSHPPTGALGRDLELMADHARSMFRQAMEAFNTDNAEMARGVKSAADQLEIELSRAIEDLTLEGQQGREVVGDLIDLSSVFYMWERVSDRAKNICEETLFMVIGETKAAKVLNILFVDEHNAVASQIAEAIGRKGYPTTARFHSAGRTPAAAIHSQVADFMRKNGMDLEGLSPKGLAGENLELKHVDILVSLEGAARSYPIQIPFHTAFFDWQVGSLPQGLSDGEARAALEKMHREIAMKLRELLEIMRGEEGL